MTTRRFAATAVALVLLAGLFLVPSGAAQAPHPAAMTNVLAVYQTPDRVTPVDAFSVHLQVASTANIESVYFTFCQLTSSLCYLPIVMNPTAGGWYVGTTHPMPYYPGMKLGVRAGYNITIVTNDNLNLTEPALPNTFSNLTIAQTITGENMFEMMVVPEVFALTGQVADAATGHALSGANVSLDLDTAANAPAASSVITNASGGYAFAGILNGTYTLTVTKTGYRSSVVSVDVSGSATVKGVALSILGPAPDPTKSTPSSNFFTSTTGLGVIAAVALILVVMVLFVMRGRGRKGHPIAPAAVGASNPSTDTK